MICHLCKDPWYGTIFCISSSFNFFLLWFSYWVLFITKGFFFSFPKGVIFNAFGIYFMSNFFFFIFKIFFNIIGKENKVNFSMKFIFLFFQYSLALNSYNMVFSNKSFSRLAFNLLEWNFNGSMKAVLLLIIFSQFL